MHAHFRHLHAAVVIRGQSRERLDDPLHDVGRVLDDGEIHHAHENRQATGVAKRETVLLHDEGVAEREHRVGKELLVVQVVLQAAENSLNAVISRDGADTDAGVGEHADEADAVASHLRVVVLRFQDLQGDLHGAQADKEFGRLRIVPQIAEGV
eukprot:scaffold803_cov310-Pinguiococcus_pyrenoidosus.AAC.50